MERPEVPAAKSSLSTNATFKPRVDASHAHPAPTHPPPIMTKSNSSFWRRERVVAREGALHGKTVVPSSQLETEKDNQIKETKGRKERE